MWCDGWGVAAHVWRVQPNSYSKVVTVDNGMKKIIIFAKRPIAKGDELVYDYQFPFEENAIQCNCGAANCVGRMN